MPTEIVVLKPTIGDNLTISSSPYDLGMETTWGDHTITPGLATGPDVIGGVVGMRERGTTQATVPVWVKATSASSYVAAMSALETASAQLAQHGGTLTRQVDFGGGNLSEELETEVVACDLSLPDGWLQAHRTTGLATLTIARNPGWLGEEVALGGPDAWADSTFRYELSTRRGNLPGPGRILLAENSGTAPRRFAEIGGAFDQTPQQAEYFAFEFDPVGGGSLESDSDAVLGDALELTPVLPKWTIVGLLAGLPHAGGFTVRLRTKGGEDDAQFVWRVVWRAGESGTWQELGRVQTPDAENYYDLPVGVINHFGEAETIDVRVDVRSTAPSTETAALDYITIFPNELYVTASGVPVEVPAVASDAYDDFSGLDPGRSLDDSDGGGTNHTAILGGAWSEAGSDADVEWVSPQGTYVERKSANDSAFDGARGSFILLGTTNYPDITNTIRGRVEHNGTAGTESILGNLVRYVDSSNWLMATLRVRRLANGNYKGFIDLFKRDGGGTPVEVEPTYSANDIQVEIGTGRVLEASLSVSVSTAGAYTVSVGTNLGMKPVMSGTDSDLASPSGTHKTGKIGAFSLIESSRATAKTTLYELSAYGSVPAFENTDVVRADGIGEFTHDHAYAADADGSDPQEFTPVGSRIWLPPGDGGEIALKTRSGDSNTQPDQGYELDTGVTVYHRPAWANLADALDS